MRTKNGGQAIASGGFGCVFRPALKCKGQTRRDVNKITKLMLKKYAIEEYDDVIKFEDVLKKIPSYEKYFLIDGFQLCDPSHLDEEDLKQFKEKCTALPKKNIDKYNINSSLDKLLALNMPDGGLALDDFMEGITSYSLIIQINNSLLDLLENGIIPMNKNHIYHCDIKDSNILVDKNKNHLFLTRLIDWGLSTFYFPNKKQKIPKTWHNRPFQFNTPFSIIIFSDKFSEKYTQFLKTHKDMKIKEAFLKNFITEFIFYWLKERGSGHFKFINSIMNKLFFLDFPSDIKNQDSKIKNKYIEKKYTIPYITNYIYIILLHYTETKKDGSVSFDRYLNEIFIKIVDVYGFIVCYYPVLEIYYENYENLTLHEKKIYYTIKEIFLKYLYEPRIEIINVDDLKHHLKSLNTQFEVEIKLHSKSFNILSKTQTQSYRGKKKSSSFSKTRKNHIPFE
jgi:hypothetical protein